MYTYLLMGLPFIGFVLLLDLVILRTRVILEQRTWLVMVVLVVLTAVFDQLLTGLPIVLYTSAHTLGVRLGYAPIEDFTYTIAVVIGVGALLKYGKQKHWL